jgi:GH15 family glucan-1,4-alpha-glucosidase
MSVIQEHKTEWLAKRSHENILENQADSGAYIASPNFPTYHYCWFRDGSYIAYAMDLWGKYESSSKFHEWSAGVINAREDIIRRGIQKAEAGLDLTEADILHTRYTLDGSEGTIQKWENFQLDGLGTWLWSIQQSVELSGNPPSVPMLHAARLIADYLSALWNHPCYDCWEEHVDQIHPHTLAAIYGGLTAYSKFSGEDYSSTTAFIKKFIEEHAETDGHWAKSIGNSRVDASLLGLAIPYHVFPLDDPRTIATVAAIEHELRKEAAGVHRYAADVYYGGGEWLLLTSWLGWYYAEAGQVEKASALHQWVENQANEQGWLPEQIPSHLNHPESYAPWVEKWGEIASPLLWSHAMYLILEIFLV